MTSRLRQLFDQSSKTSVSVRKYQGQTADAAFEICTADTFVAGIASRVLEGQKPESAFLAILANPLMNGTCWVMPDKQLVDLSATPELLQAARLVEDLRMECRKVVDSRHSPKARRSPRDRQ
jgi:hypothetical protein